MEKEDIIKEANRENPAGSNADSSRQFPEDANGAGEKPLEQCSREELIAEILELREKNGEISDLYLRSQAEMDNMKKRHQKEKADWLRFSNEKLIKEILPVIDNLETALCHTDDGQCVTALREGVELTLKGLLDALERAGVQAVCAKGEDFDPCYHEAISMYEDPNQGAGKILEEIQKGYVMNDRLIRPSLVVVNKDSSGGGG